MNCEINTIMIETKWIFALRSRILQVEPLFILKLVTHMGGAQGLLYLRSQTWYVSDDHKAAPPQLLGL